MIKIKRSDPRYNTWLKKRNAKIFLKEVNRRKRKGISRIGGQKYTYNSLLPRNEITYRSRHQAKAPENFSIISNPSETVSYFNSVIGILKREKNGTGIYFDIENVTNLTIDSIMYLVAMLKNIKMSKMRQYSFTGNFPKDRKINSLLNESGFLNYVMTKNKINITKKGENIEIRTGKEINQLVAKELCDFVNKILKRDTKYTKFLYNMLIELMTNTIQHAYDESWFLINHWYLFAENGEDSIKFIFLDTGIGVPQTITKKFLENVLINRKESEYIYSALKGEFRSSTRLGYRGKGLPKIYEYYTDGIISDLAIVSGKGYCVLEKNVYDIEDVFNGTLFYWEIRKGS